MRGPLLRPAVALFAGAVIFIGLGLTAYRAGREAEAEDEPVAKPLVIPCAVEVIDVETGKPLEAEWTPEGTLRHGYSSIRLSVTAPAGYVTWERPSYAAQISRLATSALALCPLHRELDLSIEVRGRKGKVPGKPHVNTVELTGGGDRRDVPSEEVAAGSFKVRGVAVLRGESLTIRGGGSVVDERGKDEFVWGIFTFVVPPRGEARVKGRLQLGPFEEPPVVFRTSDHMSRLGERGFTSTTLVRGRFRPNRKGGWERRVASVGSGPLRIVARTSDGQPARRTSIEIRTHDGGTKVLDTDERGEVAMQAPLGPVEVWLVEPGLVPAVRPAEVTKAGGPAVEVQEPIGGKLDVVVVTEDGRAVPCARLDVDLPSGEPWIDLTNGIQRIDDFTDAEGRRSLHRVEPGSVQVYATWCLKSGKASVRVADGKRAEVRIVVR